MTTRTYMGLTITKNMNGKWIVTWANGSHTQHATLADAKAQIAFRAA